jgi:hypothetical protein
VVCLASGIGGSRWSNETLFSGANNLIFFSMTESQENHIAEEERRGFSGDGGPPMTPYV